MVRPLYLIAANAFCLPGLAVAGECKFGHYYCGHTLLDLGDYSGKIKQALIQAGQPTDCDHVNSSLYYCAAPSVAVPFVTYCGDPPGNTRGILSDCGGVRADSGLEDFCGYMGRAGG